jgi:hypothetical protein
MNRRILIVLVCAAACLPAGCDDERQTAGRSMVVSVQRRPWHSPMADGVLLRTRDYRIYSTTSNRLLAKYLPGFMEASLSSYHEISGLPYRAMPEGMPVYMLGSRREWEALTRNIVGPQAETYLSISAGGYCFEGTCVFWDIGGLGTLSVAAHEGLHQFFRHRLRDRLPMWLEEGLCTLAEGYEINGERVMFTPERNLGRFSDLRRALTQGTWIPLPRLLPMDAGHAIGGKMPEEAVGYYGQLWALARFLRSRPDLRAKLSRLLADAEAGRLYRAMDVPPEALAKLRPMGRAYNQTISRPVFRFYIAQDLEAFAKEYRAYAMRLAELE